MWGLNLFHFTNCGDYGIYGPLAIVYYQKNEYLRKKKEILGERTFDIIINYTSKKEFV